MWTHSHWWNFKFFGMLFLIDFHLTVFAYPSYTFSIVSSLRTLASTGSSADLCGPLLSAWMMWLVVQASPMSTGQPLVLNWSSRGAAGCSFAIHLGHMSPNLPISSLTGWDSGMTFCLSFCVGVILKAWLGFLVYCWRFFWWCLFGDDEILIFYWYWCGDDFWQHWVRILQWFNFVR